MSAQHPAHALLVAEAEPAFVAQVDALVAEGAEWTLDQNAGHPTDVWGLLCDGRIVLVVFSPVGERPADFDYDTTKLG